MSKRRKRGRGHRGDALPGPDDLFSAGGADRRAGIKEAQLCAQVRETLSFALADTTDETLLSVFVIDVVPAPDSSRLAVKVEAPGDPDVVHERLARELGRLRTEMAHAIHRKKVPNLTFVVFPTQRAERDEDHDGEG
ncbi:MAG: ribosome-binding factor A [Sandaracinaceae bacterium]